VDHRLGDVSVCYAVERRLCDDGNQRQNAQDDGLRALLEFFEREVEIPVPTSCPLFLRNSKTDG